MYSTFGDTNHLANKAAHTMSASARLFHFDRIRNRIETTGTSTRKAAAIV
ncbi:hypothetical protein VDG1235_450 [Verrucomicrobiia bacterium DG1235]|nr:hypothetical protein VDG1235_450 [Verrucomicrobiae bacterium DG1235]